jgi:predicted MFS family arabinose efflux permease
MQIPLGIMLDRVSFRFVTFISISVTAIGTLSFVLTDNWNILLLSRFVIGAGSGVAFLAVAKVIKTFFQERHHSIMIGLSFSLGLTGAFFGATPMRLLFEHFGYDNTFKVLAIVAFAIALLMLALGKIERDNEAQQNDANMGQIIKLLFNPRIILIGISGALMVGSLEGFSDAWSIPFFEQIYGMTSTESTLAVSFVFIGMCFGGPILALAASAIRSANGMVCITGIATILIFLMLFYGPILSFTQSSILMFILGILCCYQVLVFSVVSSYVSPKSAGLAIAITNCINMSFGHFFHVIIGNTIECSWDGAVLESGAARYSLDAFITSLSIIPVCCVVGVIGFAILAITDAKKSS